MPRTRTSARTRATTDRQRTPHHNPRIPTTLHSHQQCTGKKQGGTKTGATVCVCVHGRVVCGVSQNLHACERICVCAECLLRPIAAPRILTTLHHQMYRQDRPLPRTPPSHNTLHYRSLHYTPLRQTYTHPPRTPPLRTQPHLPHHTCNPHHNPPPQRTVHLPPHTCFPHHHPRVSLRRTSAKSRRVTTQVCLCASGVSRTAGVCGCGLGREVLPRARACVRRCAAWVYDCMT